ncbi:MAG TPA: DUF262 domain-containing protein [Bacteroidia bacterium]|nr:DUF262 domain-containing protein [Bacteroidia bacterium]
MAYEKPITIKDAIENIQKKKYVLPSIQREFVWEANQIEKLFDSLLRDYPISTFLFWNVEKLKINEFQFYEFLQHYHERDATHNPKASLANDEDVIAILDGQQRLTSLFIALKGTYAEKLPYYSWDSNKAFPKKKLYINLIKEAEDVEMLYNFKFLTEEEIKNQSDGFYWYEVSNIFDIKEYPDVMTFLISSGLTDSSKYTDEQIRFSMNTMNNLYNAIHQKGTINFYLERSDKLDKVLQIFIRINSGGTKLSYSDLLLSVATAQWQEKDARQEIHDFVDELNGIGQGFDFDKDFVLKSCLVLGDFNDVKFKVDNFTKTNMLKIESLWNNITQSVYTAVKLVSNFGFNRSTLTSANTLIPIAYYLMKNNHDEAFLTKTKFELERQKIRQWLLRVLLKRVFSGTPDNLYPQLRKLINDGNGEFPLQSIIEFYRGTNKSIIYNSDDINTLVEMEYGNKFSFAALAIIYPELNLVHTFHMDHIHPKKFFSEVKLKKRGIIPEHIKFFLENYNKLSNIQLLEGNLNKQKNGTELSSWLNDNFKTSSASQAFKMLHMIPENISLELDNFQQFYNVRKSLLVNKFSEILLDPTHANAN